MTILVSLTMFSFPPRANIHPCQRKLSRLEIVIVSYHFRELMEQEEAFGSDARFLQIRQNDAAGVLEKSSILLNHKLVLISFLF